MKEEEQEMKRYGILALALVMCCALFTGCRRGNGNMQPVSPTNQATTETPTMPVTIPATKPATEPATTAPTERETSGATENTTDGTEHGTTDATAEAPGRTITKQPATR